jgi:hypothetical protein
MVEKVLPWISRHKMTNGQRAILPLLGFDKESRVEVEFGNDPSADLKRIGVQPTTIGVVAPHHTIYALLVGGYRVVEFVNHPSARQRGVFLCHGAFLTYAEKVVLSHPSLDYKPDILFRPFRHFYPCPLGDEEQEEGDLSPMRKEGTK